MPNIYDQALISPKYDALYYGFIALLMKLCVCVCVCVYALGCVRGWVVCVCTRALDAYDADVVAMTS